MFASLNARAVGLPDLSTERTIDVASDAGFAGVDLMVRDLVRAGADLGAIRRRLDDRGLRAGAFPMPLDWRGDDASFRRGLDELASLADAAAQLGLTRTGTWVLPETPDFPPPHGDPASHRAGVAAWHVDRLGAIARILAPFGIALGLEVIGVATFRRGQGLPFVARLADLKPTLGDLLREPNVGLLADAFHLYAAAEPPETVLAWGIDRVVWVHVADLPPGPIPDRSAIRDPERGLPNPTGVVGCPAFLQALADAGYAGPVTAEPLARCAALVGLEPAEVAWRTKAALDTCWPSTCSSGDRQSSAIGRHVDGVASPDRRNFLTKDRDIGRGLDPKANLISINLDDSQDDRVANHNLFAELPAKNEHGRTSSKGANPRSNG